MTTATLVERILDKYQGADGDWVIPRGNVAAVKLLKEAVAMIQSLKAIRNTYYDQLNELRAEKNKTRAEIYNEIKEQFDAREAESRKDRRAKQAELEVLVNDMRLSILTLHH